MTRSRDSDDGRGVTVSITADGLGVFTAAQETHLADLDRQLFSKLTAREIEQLAVITSKLIADEHTG